MGARRETFAGLSGLGDLITTCMSPHSRNRRMGMELASGKTLKEASATMEMVAEGVETAKSVFRLAQKYKIEMPIATGIYKILHENKKAKTIFKELITGQEVESLETN